MMQCKPKPVGTASFSQGCWKKQILKFHFFSMGNSEASRLKTAGIGEDKENHQ